MTEPLFPTVTSDHGKTWRQLRPPHALRRTGAGDVAFVDGNHGLIDSIGPYPPVFSTDDAGRTWHRVPLPGKAHDFDFVALAPGIVVLTTGSRVFVTADAGRRWRSFPVARLSIFCSVARPTPPDIWLLCANDVFTGAHVVLLKSHDGGVTWTRRTTRMPLNTDQFAAINAREAWAASYGVGPPMHAPRVDDPGKLWHTTDGGATWRQVWVAFSPSAQAAAVTSR
jgi:photosystem II stability/assembly factor-like uncharacterized protein